MCVYVCACMSVWVCVQNWMEGNKSKSTFYVLPINYIILLKLFQINESKWSGHHNPLTYNKINIQIMPKVIILGWINALPSI